MAPSLHAQGTQWSVSSNQNTIRNEGDAEAVGTITLTTTSTGTIESSSGFWITYYPSVASYGNLYAVGVACPTSNSTPLVCSALALSVKGETVTLTYTNATPFTISGTNSINVTARVQAQGFAAGTLIPVPVFAFYKFGNQPLIINSFGGVTVGVGTVQGPATTVTLAEGPENVLTCIGVKGIPGTSVENDFALRVAENWNDALTSLSDEYNLENNDASNLAGSATPAYPTNGSNILITLAGMPDDVGVVARKPRPCVSSPASAPNYCAQGKLTIGDPVALAGTAPYGATHAFWYQVNTTNVEAMEFADFGFRLWSQGPLPPNQGYQITATVSLTDQYPATVATAPPNGDMPWFSSPETASPLPVVYFFDCVTTLLFPYINTLIGRGSNAFSNFGTGIALANTTLDPLALPGPYAGPCPGGSCLYSGEAPGTATPQSGSCTLYFYPADGSATQVYTTPGISAGGSFAFDVASGVPSFAGKTGYAIAICNFQNAYGFAEIYDNYLNLAGAGPYATVGYLAKVLPNPALYPRIPPGDWLGEGAIAPIEVEQDRVNALLAIIRRRRLRH